MNESFVNGFVDEMAKIAVTVERRGVLRSLKEGFGPDVKAVASAAKGITKKVVGAGRSVYKRLTEGGPKSQAMMERVRAAAREGR